MLEMACLPTAFGSTGDRCAGVAGHRHGVLHWPVDPAARSLAGVRSGAAVAGCGGRACAPDLPHGGDSGLQRSRQHL